jgi:hypothetical protein
MDQTFAHSLRLAFCRTVKQNCTQGQCRWYFRTILHFTGQPYALPVCASYEQVAQAALTPET